MFRGFSADRRAERRATPPALALLLLVLAAIAWTTGSALAAPKLASELAQVAPGDLVPGADRFGDLEGEPPIAPAYRGRELIGYAYLNTDFVNAAGYSGKPIHILVGLDPSGTIVGTRLREHHEPIVLVGIPQAKIEAFLSGYHGYNALEATAAASGDAPDVDIVSGATVTVMVMADSLTRSAARVARRLNGQPEPQAVARERRAVNPQAGEVTDWQTLLGEGSVRRLLLTVGDVNDAFADDAEAASRPEQGAPETTFIDLYVALVSQPAIGRSLLGEQEYANLAAILEPGQDAILVAGTGRYSFKGSGYVRGGIFDRIELVQDTETVRFRDRNHRRVGAVEAAGAPEFREVDIFMMPKEVEFAAAEPWSLKLLVQRPTGALTKAFLTYELSYQLPDRYATIERPAAPVAPPAPTEPDAKAPTTAADSPVEEFLAGLSGGEDGAVPLWLRIWKSKVASIAMLLAMLAALTAIFFFQNVLVKRPVLFGRIRLAYLAVTLVWLGWVAQAQLSVVNVLAFAGAVRSNFEWSSFLIDPLIFILWFAVAAALLFWGRGPFCGWLCPFGALQELSNRAARLLRVPQYQVPWGLHERLWPIKYVVFLVIFGVSLGSLALAEQISEVEPFKTAIILRFMREWWFVGFALALLAAGLFVERFFCRYLCPLGAALAIPGRMRMFDWLRRYRECGNPCLRCFNECPVQAIHPEGHINPNECISCLHCQVLYHDDRKCPVMIQRRLKRERREARSPSSMRPAGAGPDKRAGAGGAQQNRNGVPAAPQQG